MILLTCVYLTKDVFLSYSGDEPFFYIVILWQMFWLYFCFHMFIII